MTLPPPDPAPIAVTSRRTALKLAMLGLAGAGAPLIAQAPRGFTHGVASGEPGAHQVLLWTRYASDQDETLTWEVAADADFRRIVASGNAKASPASDCCAKAWARGLKPGRWYHYRFIARDGSKSVTGRTRTLPVGNVPSFRLAVFTCANFGFGWFNAYAHAAQSGEFDLALHLGDYFYEYERGEYPSAKETVDSRLVPVNEATTLEGYRDRYRTYRNDPDLQRLHQMMPMVCVWDDHETANDTWQNGAENHQPGEGDWALRKAASEQAWREWLPVSDDYYAQYEIGQLATLFRLETRHLARSLQLDLGAVAKGAAPGQLEAAFSAFRDGAWRSEERTLMGPKQEAWLGRGMKASVRAGKSWQVLVQQVIMGEILMGDSVIANMPASTPAWLKQTLVNDVAAAHVGVPYNLDSWDGYPAARARLLDSALAADANLIVLAGDSHNAWAFDLDRHDERVGVEMASTSVTSPGAEGSIPWLSTDELERATVERNRQLKWCDLSRRGYMAVELTPTRATSEWRFLASVRQKGTALAGVKRMTVLAGQRKFSV
ncbi:MAG: alkaline phosphatase D family protein [Sphingomonadaceae bacterium]